MFNIANELNESPIGCRAHLNPNGSDLRCGDKVNNINWNASEGVIQLCQMCSLKKKNATLLEMLNRQQNDSRSDKGGKKRGGGF